MAKKSSTSASGHVPHGQHRVLLDAGGLHRLGVEDHAVVVYLDGAHLDEQSRQPCGIRRATPEKVEVLRGPVRSRGPRSEEHGPFENEGVAVLRAREPHQEPLERVPDQNLVEFLALGLRQREQTRANRMGDVGWGRLHARASRYGRITHATRQASAALLRWSIERFRDRRYSRRASRATSRPILFRYLKQSATVFSRSAQTPPRTPPQVGILVGRIHSQVGRKRKRAERRSAQPVVIVSVRL